MIPPVSPRASLLLLAYNQEATIRAAAESCLAQECEPIEIVLSDDASTDNTFTILQELAANYRGPHRVRARRNATNVGIGEHYNRLLTETRGQLLVTAAGDDCSLPGRVRTLLAAWDATQQRADLIASHVVDMNHDGTLHDVLHVDDLSAYRNPTDWAERRPHVIGAGHAFTRRLMRRFGPLANGIFYEDQIMVFRAIASGGAITVDEPLVHYRRGGTSRQPDFESATAKRHWAERQISREAAEMQQLMADSRIARCEALMRAHLGKRFARTTFLDRINASSCRADLWAAYDAAESLPRSWRLRKMSHVAYPRTTLAIRRLIDEFHAWRHSVASMGRRHALASRAGAPR